MGRGFKNYIFLLTTHLLMGFLGKSYRQISETIFMQWSSVQFSFGYNEQDESTVLPYHEELPSTKREVHSPLYLIQLAKLEGFIFTLLTEVEELYSANLDPKLLQKIQTYGTHNSSVHRVSAKSVTHK